LKLLLTPLYITFIFLISVFDPHIKKAFGHFLHLALKNPALIFNPVYVQSVHLQQPNEILNGKVNLCDDCVNMMAYKGQLINSCRLDEYRKFGEALQVVNLNK